MRDYRQYWDLDSEGICWLPGELPDAHKDSHKDSIEMSGLLASYIVTFGIDEEGRLELGRHCIWPTLRTIPNDTHASYQVDILEGLPALLVSGRQAGEYADAFRLDVNGMVHQQGTCGDRVSVCFSG
ncbi:MAG: hypothetical protein LBK46_00215 [Oscillospiraceae bacterium]|nr:hypothetical protein [Oscillospiraceae bacterium]